MITEWQENPQCIWFLDLDKLNLIHIIFYLKKIIIG